MFKLICLYLFFTYTCDIMHKWEKHCLIAQKTEHAIKVITIWKTVKLLNLSITLKIDINQSD